MINKQHNFSDHDAADVSGLISTIKRVEAPGDFNFRVKARIAQGRPAQARSSWSTLALRLSLPVVVLATAGGYLGYRSVSSDNFSANVVNDVATAPAVTTNLPRPLSDTAAVRSERPGELTPAVVPDALASTATDQPGKVARTAQKSAVPPTPETEKPGGSYDSAVRGAKTLNQPDVDDNDTKPVRQVLVSAAQFLSSSGVVATSSGAGGRIESVSGLAARSGLRPGDVIESVSVKMGTVRVTRDGTSLTVSFR